MCGIVYARRSSGASVAKHVLKRYTKQSGRGQDGFGFVGIENDGRIGQYIRHQNENGIRKALKATEFAHVLFHHRYPTSTVNVAESAHPILVQHDELKHDYFVVHNGILSNEQELRPVHEALGYKYTTAIKSFYKTATGTRYNGDATFNDSESLAIELARTIEGLQPAVKAEGSIAYIALQATKEGKALALYYGTNGGNPLTFTDNGDLFTLASEGGQALPSGVDHRQDLETGILTYPDLGVPNYYSGRAVGFSDKKWDDGDDESAYNPYSGRESWEYRAETMAQDIEDLRTRMYECKADMAIAEQAGEWSELSSLQEEYIGLAEDLQELEEEERALY